MNYAAKVFHEVNSLYSHSIYYDCIHVFNLHEFSFYSIHFQSVYNKPFVEDFEILIDFRHHFVNFIFHNVVQSIVGEQVNFTVFERVFHIIDV